MQTCVSLNTSATQTQQLKQITPQKKKKNIRLPLLPLLASGSSLPPPPPWLLLSEIRWLTGPVKLLIDRCVAAGKNNKPPQIFGFGETCSRLTERIYEWIYLASAGDGRPAAGFALDLNKEEQSRPLFVRTQARLSASFSLRQRGWVGFYESVKHKSAPYAWFRLYLFKIRRLQDVDSVVGGTRLSTPPQLERASLQQWLPSTPWEIPFSVSNTWTATLRILIFWRNSCKEVASLSTKKGKRTKKKGSNKATG